MPVPGQPPGVRLMLPAGTAGAAEPGEPAGEVVGQPLPHAAAELLVLRAELHPFLPAPRPAVPGQPYLASGCSRA